MLSFNLSCLDANSLHLCVNADFEEAFLSFIKSLLLSEFKGNLSIFFSISDDFGMSRNIVWIRSVMSVTNPTMSPDFLNSFRTCCSSSCWNIINYPLLGFSPKIYNIDIVGIESLFVSLVVKPLHPLIKSLPPFSPPPLLNDDLPLLVLEVTLSVMLLLTDHSDDSSGTSYGGTLTVIVQKSWY